MIMSFGSSEAATQQAGIVAHVCVIAIGILCVFAIYIVLRTVFTKSENLPAAPRHIGYAVAVLKWIASTSLLLSLIAVCFEIYDELLRIALVGTFELYHFAGALISGLVLLGIGCCSALVVMIGIALIFFKKIRFEKRKTIHPPDALQ